jgi:predicted DNA-binding antitoxin AbrB/MazE fold protein
MSEPITVEAVYENGVLRPAQPLPLKEGERVTLTVQPAEDVVRRSAGMLQWKGTHEELEAFLNDPDELYGSPEDWFPPRPPEKGQP